MSRKIKIGDILYASEKEHGKVMVVLSLNHGMVKVIYPDGHVGWEYQSLVLKPFSREEKEKIKKGIPVY